VRVPSGGRTRPVGPPDAEGKVPDRPVLGSGDEEIDGKFEQVEVALPVFFALSELVQPARREQLTGELGKARSFRIELTCRDATRAFGRLEPAFKAARLGLVIDATAQNRLKKPQWKTDYALFAENLAPADLGAILVQAARADLRATSARFDGTLLVKA